MQNNDKNTDTKNISSPAEGVLDAAAVPAEAAETAVAPDSAVTPEELERLRSEAAKARDHWERLLRTTADFENFKRRTARERQEASKYASGPVLRKLMPVLDSLEVALAATRAASDNSVQSLQEGITMIHEQLRQALAEAGLAEVDAVGQPFDPNWHEAVSQQEAATVPEGHVLQQLRKGYKLHDRLLRPATVVVAKGPAAETGAVTASSPENQ